MRKPTPLPRPRQGMPFAVTTAVGMGVGRGRLRGADLVIPFRGTRPSSSEAPTVTLVAETYASRRPGHQAFSHRTAAALLGLRLPEGRNGQRAAQPGLDEAVMAPHRAPRRLGVRGHEIQSSVVIATLTNGLRVTSPIDTLIQLASELSVDDLIVMGDGLVSRNSPHATVHELVPAVGRSANRTGTARLREALPWIRARTDSARETLLRLMIVRGASRSGR